MKITVEVPDWAKERVIYVIAGLELLAIKMPNEPLMIKRVRCSSCGKCCMDVPKDHFAGVNVDGDCKQLGYNKRTKTYICEMGYYKPIPCCAGHGDPSYCKVIMKETK